MEPPVLKRLRPDESGDVEEPLDLGKFCDFWSNCWILILDESVVLADRHVSELIDALETLNLRISGVSSVNEASNVSEESLGGLIASLKSLVECANKSIVAVELLDKRR